jgi:Trypsin-like peptidase domain/Effector-associated domain 1
MDLTGRQFETLLRALVSAFPNQAAFYGLGPHLRDALGGRPLDAVTQGALENRFRELIERAEAEGWTRVLVETAHERVPGNPRLHAFFGAFEQSIQRDIDSSTLERLVVAGQKFKEPRSWRESLETMETRVCRIEVDRGHLGTGFLVGPDHVLTNAHVLEGVALARVSARFDGTAAGVGGHACAVAELVQSSPPSVADFRYPRAVEATAAELDFALIRLDGRPGDDIVASRGKPRGHVPIASIPRVCRPPETLFILQHPDGEPLRLAFDACLAVNEPGTRVSYRVNTLNGSSGSPCFGQDWDLVALHHGADPRGKKQAEFNEGIPLAAIVGQLTPDARNRIAL